MKLVRAANYIYFHTEVKMLHHTPKSTKPAPLVPIRACNIPFLIYAEITKHPWSHSPVCNLPVCCVVFLLICPSSRTCPTDEHKIEWVISQLRRELQRGTAVALQEMKLNWERYLKWMWCLCCLEACVHYGHYGVIYLIDVVQCRYIVTRTVGTRATTGQERHTFYSIKPLVFPDIKAIWCKILKYCKKKDAKWMHYSHYIAQPYS